VVDGGDEQADDVKGRWGHGLSSSDDEGQLTITDFIFKLR